ncbi:MAG: double-strand break repair helicase AddA [Alphaproteobacteria bacterium]|nr:double-strand break repair helicase AddA [Alphaproteobacteria bacterium]
MAGPRSIPEDVLARQARASDPLASAFVSANAGAGKTHVLVQRVIRLLLNGVAPEKILCITFTKAAAANMAERVFATLGRWVRLDDAELDEAIAATGIPRPDARLRDEARRLFACALEAPGGLKVQTIHALCTRLLQQFPFEANVPARFAVMDDRDQTNMMERANLKVLLEAARDGDSTLGRALATGMAWASDEIFQEVVSKACLSRDHFQAWIDRAGSVESALAGLHAVLGVDAADSFAALHRDIVDGPLLPRRQWQEVASAIDRAGGGAIVTRLRDAAQCSGSDQVDAWLDVFFTKKRTLRGSLLTKPCRSRNPSLAGRFDEEAGRLEGLIARRRALVVRDRTVALVHVATAVSAAYRREKAERGLLDYDDLIVHTLAMLNRVSAGWVHYKLDRGVDHVLIDEAQDTSPSQWEIVAHLIAEFSAGAGARGPITRTVFAVGDEKQSIFSFQGAAPREFDHRRRQLQRDFVAAGLKFDPIAFNYSFRSGAAILHAVDQVFQDAGIFHSIHAQDTPPLHQALEDAGRSLIDLWDLTEHDQKQDIEGWRAPFDGVAVTSAEVKLARRVEGEIRRLIGDGTLTGPNGRRRLLRFGDVLVLVRKRGAVFNAVIQALKHANIPVAGADRLKLTEHIAIIDLMNLTDALLLPADDLALAVALKRPLFGLDDDDLFKLGHDREGTLRQALEAQAAGNARFDEARGRLVACEVRAQESPFAFYAWVLGDGGRARMLRRLGPEANDALDEFLELALSYETKAPASLQGFMAWLRAADTEVKRDMEISRDEVRVMTVHGAKGLEAPVVFLVDTTTSPTDRPKLPLIDMGEAAGDVVVWAGSRDEDPPVVGEARARMLAEVEDEYRRLLYVAMTRAADRLIIGGYLARNRSEVRELSWYDLIDKGLRASGLKEEVIDSPVGRVRRFTRGDGADEEVVAAGRGEARAELPTWLREGVVDVIDGCELRPSSSEEEDEVPAAPQTRTREEADVARLDAVRRGTLAHRLLQSLPDLDPSRRPGAALEFLARNAPDWSQALCQRVVDQVLAVIENPSFAPVFCAGSRAEVSIIGRLEREGRSAVLVSGQIDRLVVGDGEVLIVDYKTNQRPPVPVTEAPRAYVRQLALYRAVLAALYPSHQVRAALLWTEIPELVEVPHASLDAALEAVLRR